MLTIKEWEQKTLGIFERTYSALKDKFSAISNVKSSTSLFNDILFNKTITNTGALTFVWAPVSCEVMWFSINLLP